MPVSVESIDFASWMCQMQLCDHDAVFVKLSMEGAEYGLLNQLNSENLLCKADKWFVDWHVDTKLMPHAHALKKDIIKAGKQCWHKKGKFESLA